MFDPGCQVVSIKGWASSARSGELMRVNGRWLRIDEGWMMFDRWCLMFRFWWCALGTPDRGRYDTWWSWFHWILLAYTRDCDDGLMVEFSHLTVRTSLGIQYIVMPVPFPASWCFCWSAIIDMLVSAIVEMSLSDCDRWLGGGCRVGVWISKVHRIRWRQITAHRLGSWSLWASEQSGVGRGGGCHIRRC